MDSVITKIVFDGGTSCNVPRLGYGIGYGSYQLDDGVIVRLDHKKQMSANTAEILTALCAIRSVPKTNHLFIIGDSQIALGWIDSAAGNRKSRKISKKSSPEFREAVSDLLRHFSLSAQQVRTYWKGREAMVSLFGH